MALAAALAVLLAGVAGWWLWRQKQDRMILFNRLPGENVLLFYLDADRLRHAAALAPLVRQRVEPDPDYKSFVQQTGFDYQRDLDAAAVCYLTDRVYVLARGRFDAARLRQYALAQGGSCEGNGLDRPCRMPASQPGRTISFLLISPAVLALATAPEPDAVRQLQTTPQPNAEPLAHAAAAAGDPPPLLWATATPAGLDRALSDSTFLSPNLALFSRTLAGAQRAYLLVADQSPNLQISLRAVCASEAQAGEMRRLLQGLNDLVGGIMHAPRPGKEASVWQRVLASAAISQEKNTVRASWTLDQTVLESFGAPAGAPPGPGAGR
ncbi:MAG TPA: hypothetical protein VEU62_08890 [Bryobacterales bacterium]|nr:hypothetical protein [Bryobacterales bacterium]